MYFIKNKLDTFERFKKFKAIAKNQSGRHIKVLRSNGGEYDSKGFVAYFRQQGIHTQFTT